jgi:hypothetical protein
MSGADFTMIANPVGSMCPWPMQPYCPADLNPAGHVAIWERLYQCASYDGLSEDAAEEAASRFYAHWLSRKYGQTNVARGSHGHAYASTARYARLSGWRGFTGQRRNRKAKITGEQIASQERLRCRNQPLPTDPAIGVERLLNSPALRRKAERLASRLGMSAADMVRVACGFCAD